MSEELEGQEVACPECGDRVVVLGDGIVIDEDGTEHECNSENPYPDVYED